MTAALLAAAAAYARARRRQLGLRWSARSLLLLVPAADIVIALAQRRRRLGDPAASPACASTSRSSVPDDARTMVVVPTMLTSVASVAALLEHIEVLALGNLDPRIHFAILSDFVDADAARPAWRRRRFSPPRATASRRSIAGSARDTRSILPVSSRAALERARTGVDGMGAQARQDRGIQPAAARRDGHELRRPGRRTGGPADRSATASRWTPTRVYRATRRKSWSASSRIR